MNTLADQLRERLTQAQAGIPAPSRRIDREARLIITRTRIALLSGSRKSANGERSGTAFFGSLAMRLAPVEDRSLDRPMASDGTVLRYQPELVKQWAADDLESLLALTITRCAALHPWRRGKRDTEMWNRAGELATTPLLIDAGFTLPPGAQHDPRFNDHAAEQVYAVLEREQTPPSGQGGGQGTSGPGDEDGHPSASQIDDAPPEDEADQDEAGDDIPGQGEQDWKLAALQSEMAAKRQGAMPGGADRLLDDIRRPRDNPWLLLRRFLSSAAKADYRWFPANRRYISAGLYLPSLKSERVGPIVVAIDTSGSIAHAQLMAFAGHLQAILEDVRPERTHVLYCDAAVHKVEVFEDDETLELRPDALRNIGGGRGTDFHPVFERIETDEINPVCVVYFTDMMGRFPEDEPPYPLLWGSTSNIVNAPCGEVVSIAPDDW